MSLGSLNAYEEYPARWCWVPPSCRCCEEEPSNSEESPQLSIFELELERREYERKTQEIRPFFQKRMYWCFSLRRWQVILLFGLIFGAFVGLLSASLYFSNEILKKKKELNEINGQLGNKHVEIEKIEARARRAEEKVKDAEERVRQFEEKVKDAKARVQQAGKQAEDSEIRARRAEEKVEDAETRVQQAEKQAEDAKARAHTAVLKYENVKQKKRSVTRVAIYNAGVAYLKIKNLSYAEQLFRKLVDSKEEDEVFFRARNMLERIMSQRSIPTMPLERIMPKTPPPSQRSIPTTPPPSAGSHITDISLLSVATSSSVSNTEPDFLSPTDLNDLVDLEL